MRVDHPRLAKWLGVAVVIVLVGGWAWSSIKSNFPLIALSFPQIHGQAVELMNPGLSGVKTTLILELRKKEDALATSIPALMQAGKYGQVKTNTQELIDLRKDIEKLLAQTVTPKPVASARSTLPGITLEVSLTNGEIRTVSDLNQGQGWRYLSFIGAFSHRVDKGDGQASWKLVENNLPWYPDCPGKLQVKAGNTPVKLTVNIFP
ncbi:MAG: hypothetical protein Q7K35_03700 [bacterium]|nr:hypothetical protein [bacterium]